MTNYRRPEVIGCAWRSLHLYLMMVVFLAMWLCACEKQSTRIPPDDVPLFGAKRLILREYGPGGYKLTYATSTEMEQVIEFYMEQMALFNWEMTAGVEDREEERMFFFSKERRLLNLHFVPLEEGIGCYFIIAETGG